MTKFNVEGARNKEMLKSFEDIRIILTYLYVNKDNYIDFCDSNIIMDADGNLLVRPKAVNFEPVKESTDDLFYICKNDITYFEMLDMIEALKKDGRYNQIKAEVAAAKHLSNKPF